MITATRRIQFCAGHRVMGHESKCAHLHGHNYVALITVKAELPGGVDGIGRVIDFSAIKNIAGKWIDDNWDHGFILHKEDNAGLDALIAFDNAMVMPANGIPFRQKTYLMPYNPTAENMAKYLLEVILPKIFPPEIKATKVRIWETENCYADAVATEESAAHEG